MLLFIWGWIYLILGSNRDQIYKNLRNERGCTFFFKKSAYKYIIFTKAFTCAETSLKCLNYCQKWNSTDSFLTLVQQEQVLPRLIRGQVHRCVGNYDRSKDVLMCVSVRPALPSELRNAQEAVKTCDAEMRALVKSLSEVWAEKQQLQSIPVFGCTQEPSSVLCSLIGFSCKPK